MEEENFLAVLRLIHEAALQPAGWDKVLRQLASLTGCVAGGLTVERPTDRRGTPLTYFGFDPDHVERAFNHYLPMNPLFEIAPRMQRGFVVANGDVVAPDVFRRSEFYNGWARPQGLCSPITVVIRRTAAAYVPLTLVRPDGAGEVGASGRDLLSRLAPHLAHAMDVSARLRAADDVLLEPTTMLQALPCGALLLNQKRLIIYANGVAKALLGCKNGGVLAYPSGEVALRDREADQRFQAAISVALGLKLPHRASQVSAPCPSGHGQLSINVSPLPPSQESWNILRDDASGQARCLVLISGMGTGRVANQYGLTPAEARVLSAVVVGKGLAEAARKLGIAKSTAQSHLDKIFQKTGTNRQAELVALTKAGFGA